MVFSDYISQFNIAFLLHGIESSYSVAFDDIKLITEYCFPKVVVDNIDYVEAKTEKDRFNEQHSLCYSSPMGKLFFKVVNEGILVTFRSLSFGLYPALWFFDKSFNLLAYTQHSRYINELISNMICFYDSFSRLQAFKERFPDLVVFTH